MDSGLCFSCRMCMPIVLALLLALGAAAWAEPPETVNVHGALVDAEGAPLSGARAYVVRFFDAESGGSQLGGDVTGTVQVSAEGLFNLPVALPAAALAAPALWYELGIDTDAPPDGDAGDDIFPQRIRVHSVPFALEAGTAAHVDAVNIGGGTVSNTEFNYLAGVTQPIQPALDAKAEAADLAAHLADTANPHAVTKVQVGLGNVDNTSDLAKPISTATQAALNTKLPKSSESYVIVEVTANVTINGNNLHAAYAAAKALTPYGSTLSASNRAVVIVPPGRYYLSSTPLTMDTNYVDLVGLSPVRDEQVIYGETHVLVQTASDVRIENLVLNYINSVTDVHAYYPNVTWNDGIAHTGSPPATRIRNCEFRAPQRGMRTTVEYAGGYEDCVSGPYSFGGFGGTASGAFTNCTGGNYAFGGGVGSTASGVFTNCMGGNYAYGGSGGMADGAFTNCTGADYAFGGANGTASGVFTGCTGGFRSFGGWGTASGVFANCTGGVESFGGYYGTASGTFANCAGGSSSFGGNYGTASGTFLDCIGGNSSFGGSNSLASGAFEGCTGGTYSFGGNGAATGIFKNCTGDSWAFGGGASGTSTGASFYGCHMTGTSYGATFRGRMEHCRWSIGIICGAEARIYRSTILGNVNLNSTAAGIAHSAVKGNIQNAGSASFNTGNLESTSVN